MSKALVKKKTFKNNLRPQPVTMQQFQHLTNEILPHINELTAPHFLDADYTAQILMSALHAPEVKGGYFLMGDIFESCIGRISKHVTYHAVQEIQARLKAKQAEDAEKASEEQTTENGPFSPDAEEISSIVQ